MTTGRVSWHTVALFIVLMVLLGSACLPLPRAWDGEGPRTVVFGDSLTYRIENGPGLNSRNRFLTDELVSRGYSGSVASMVGAKTADLARVTPKVPEPGAEILLIALGTNDMVVNHTTGATHVPLENAMGHIVNAIDEVGADCSILVTVIESGPLAASGPAFNDALRGLPNVIIADWAALAETNPDFVSDDGIHLTQAGAEAYLDLFLTTIDTCPSAP